MYVLIPTLLVSLTIALPLNGSNQQQPSNQEQRSADTGAISSPQVKPCDQKDCTKDQPEKRPEIPPWWDVTWATWGLLIFAGIAAWFAFLSFRGIEKQVTEMRKSSTDQSQAMEKSIAESVRAAAAMERIAINIETTAKQQMRAYLTVIIGGGVYQEQDRTKKFEGKPLLVNAGHTPARSVRFQAAAKILPIPAPQDFDFPIPEHVAGQGILGPQQNAVINAIVDDFVPNEEIEDIKKGKGKGLYIWGLVTYEDFFGDPHYTRFCQLIEFLPNGQFWGVYIPGYNDGN